MHNNMSRNRYITVVLAHRIRISEILPCDRKSYLTHAILPKTSSKVVGAQWLSGGVLDLRPKGHGLEPLPASLCCVLEQDTLIPAQYWFNPGHYWFNPG